MFFISVEDRSAIPQKRLNVLASNTDECGMAGRRAGSDHLGGGEAADLRGYENEEMCWKQSPTWED